MDWLLAEIRPNTFLSIVLRDWLTAILSVGIGGLFATIFVPRWQARAAAARALADKRVSLIGEATAAFRHYIVSWRRLMTIAQHEAGKGRLTTEEKARKAGFVTARNDGKDRLFDILSNAKAHFSAASGELMDSFMAWDESKAALPLDELPDLEEWRTWERRIISRLGEEVARRPS